MSRDLQGATKAIRGLLALFDDEGKFRELHQDQASVAIEEAEACLAQSANVPALTDAEIAAAWNGAVPGSADKGVEMYLHCMRAVAEAQRRKITPSATLSSTIKQAEAMAATGAAATHIIELFRALDHAADRTEEKP